MTKLGLMVLLLSTSAAASCGSSNHAPVVYGAQPTGRIYNSPTDPGRSATYPAYTAATAYSAGETGVTPAVASAGLAPLTPVDETWSEGRRDYAREPVYLAQADLPPAPSSAAPIDEPLPGQVTVLAGDTVYAISRRTGASPNAIIALNSLKAPYSLRVGQTLRVPASAVPPSRANAPQSELLPASAPAPDGMHVVRAGETLYSISRATGAPVEQLIRANRMSPPYALTIGQTLKVPGGGIFGGNRGREATADVGDLARNVSYTTPAAEPNRMFDWPVQGALIGSFGLSSAGKRNDGVNIAAPAGTPVRAAADGEIVYRGSELEGYGNLLLIKHADGFVTAYAHNDAMLVKKGDRVRKGQVIAKVGQSGSAKEPQLHFEIRQNLKAVDPVVMLGSL